MSTGACPAHGSRFAGPHGGRSLRGAGLTEYLLVVAGIALAAVATFGAFGDTLRSQAAGATMELAGLDGSGALADAVASAGRAGDAAEAGGSFFGGGRPGGGGVGGGGGGGGGPGGDPGLPLQPPGAGGGTGGGSAGGGGSGPDPSPVVCTATADACNDEMTLSSDGEDWLKEVEKLALQPYDDQVGITGTPITEWVEGATIGYGHLIGRNEWDLYKDGITQEQAEELFRQDVKPFVDKVNEVIDVEVTANEFDAMVILAYNIGEDGFASSSVAKMVNDPDAATSYDTLEDAWKAWNKSQGKVNQGLINRRAAEWDMYSQGIYRHW